jgi:hypothetical protein
LDGISSAEDGGGGAAFAVQPESFVLVAGVAAMGLEEGSEIDLTVFSGPDIEECELGLDFGGVSAEEFESEGGFE